MKARPVTCFFGLLSLVMLLLPNWAAAQEAQQSALTLQVATVGLNGEWKIRIADITAPLQLDSDRDGPSPGPRSSTGGRTSRVTSDRN